MPKVTLISRGLLLTTVLSAAGCGGGPGPGGGYDLALGANDLAGADLTGGWLCPDPMGDGQPCGAACPIGTAAVVEPGGCRCRYACNPAGEALCPCGRRCAELFTPTDGGLKPKGTGACLAGNGPGERCGRSPADVPYGHGICQQGLLCLNEDLPVGMNPPIWFYCVYRCARTADCPAGTACLDVKDQAGAVLGTACVLDNRPGGLAGGMPCKAGDSCTVGTLCDATCRPQCDGPADTTTCAKGQKCTAIVDAVNRRVAAYLCK
ncbi:MAG: hypothetical protein EXR72_15035 [Myxococcales bacterium]|nr:hypothetical protein [Myxococcales bacterium]